MNPEPMAPFFDAILIGEAEEALPQFVQLCREGLYDDRQALLAQLDETPGWYVPRCDRRIQSTRTSGRLSDCGCVICRSIDTSSTLYTPDTEFCRHAPDGNRARLRPWLSILPGGIRLSTGAGAAAGPVAGLG